MSEFKRCPICKEYGWVGKHSCLPNFGVRVEDSDPEDEVIVYADTPENAAIKYLDDRFADFDYPTEATVIVNDWRANQNAGRLYTYKITVESKPVFYADLIEDKPSGDPIMENDDISI